MDLLHLGMCMQQRWSLNGVFGGALTARILPCAHQSLCAVFRLRYGHVMIMAHQDQDGSHITGLLVNFIHHFLARAANLVHKVKAEDSQGIWDAVAPERRPWAIRIALGCVA